MSSWEGKSRGGPLGHRIFVWILRHFNLSLAYFVLQFVAAYFLLFAFKPASSLFSFYRQALGFGRFQSLVMIYRNFFTFGQVILDKVAVFSGFNNTLTHYSEGMEHIENLIALDQGAMLVSSHLGGWSLAGHFLEENGPRPRLFMLDAEHDKIKEVIGQAETKHQLDIVPITKELTHVIELAKSLRNKQFIAILGDRYLEGARTLQLPFLGRKARFPLGPFDLAVRFKVPVSFVFTVKEDKTRYRCFASPPYGEKDLQGLKNRREKTEYLASQYVKTLEQFVKRYPEQWFNYYDFWQSTENDENH